MKTCNECELHKPETDFGKDKQKADGLKGKCKPCQRVYDTRKRTTGIPHEVDHYYPLQGEFVSGLHVPANLQVLTMKENRSKGNHYSP